MPIKRWPYALDKLTLSGRYVIRVNYAVVALLPDPTDPARQAAAARQYPEAMRLLAELYPEATVAERARLLGEDVQRGLGRLAGQPIHLLRAAPETAIG